MKETLKFSDEMQAVKTKIFNAYDHIFQHFYENKEKGKGWIIWLERWLISHNGKEYFEDYFETTHTELKEKMKETGSDVEYPRLMVTRMHMSNNQTIIFSRDIKLDLPWKNIVYLDDILENIPLNMRHLFYNKINELKLEEKFFRERKRMEETKKNTNSELAKDMVA